MQDAAKEAVVAAVGWVRTAWASTILPRWGGREHRRDPTTADHDVHVNLPGLLVSATVVHAVVVSLPRCAGLTSVSRLCVQHDARLGGAVAVGLLALYLGWPVSADVGVLAEVTMDGGLVDYDLGDGRTILELCRWGAALMMTHGIAPGRHASA